MKIRVRKGVPDKEDVFKFETGERLSVLEENLSMLFDYLDLDIMADWEGNEYVGKKGHYRSGEGIK